jgi:hypothetical protein
MKKRRSRATVRATREHTSRGHMMGPPLRKRAWRLGMVFAIDMQ